MKVTLLAFIAVSALPTLADRWVVAWSSNPNIMTSTWYSSTNGQTGEMIKYKNNDCVNNPGPKGMQQFCVYDQGSDHWGYFLYVGQDWRCLWMTDSYYKDPNDQDREGRETYSEVPC